MVIFTMKKIELKYITKKATYQSDNEEHTWWPLMGISFSVDAGEALGLVGSNGSGKHTLLEIIAGQRVQTTGFVTHEVPVTYAGMETGYNPDLSGLENIKQAVAKSDIDSYKREHIISNVLDFAELGNWAYEKVSSYSFGLQARLVLAMALEIDPQIVVIDEVMSKLDLPYYTKVVRRIQELKRAGKTFIVSDNRAVVIENLCDRALWLQFGAAQDYGETAAVVQQYELANSWFNSQDVLAQTDFLARGQERQVDFDVQKLYEEFKNEQFQNGVSRKDEKKMRRAFFEDRGSDPIEAFKSNNGQPAPSKTAFKWQYLVLLLAILVVGIGTGWAISAQHNTQDKNSSAYVASSKKNSQKTACCLSNT